MARSRRPRTVEMSGALRSVCASFCDLFDHTSETARSTAEAVAAMKRGRFDVVVMNVHMASADGLVTA